MPTFQHGNAHIYYEEYGQGFPILTFAPAGLASVIDVWRQPMSPINPTTEFASKYRVIAMEQRNAGGKSYAPITAQDNWDNYTADHIALLDHLRIKCCHLFGQCIGGSFIVNLIRQQPQRIASAVLAQPIGRIGAMPAGRTARYQSWAESLKDHPEATTPCLVLAGNDEAHPWPISEALSKLIPDCEFIAEWKIGDALTAARTRVMDFLTRHTPAGV